MTAPLGIEINHFFQLRKPAIVHIGRAQSDIAQGGNFESPLGTLPGNLGTTRVVGLAFRLRHSNDAETAVRKIRHRMTFKAAGFQ